MNWTNQQTKRNKGISCNPGTDKNWNLWNDMAWLLVSFPERKEPQKSATELKKRLSRRILMLMMVELEQELGTRQPTDKGWRAWFLSYQFSTLWHWCGRWCDAQCWLCRSANMNCLQLLFWVANSSYHCPRRLYDCLSEVLLFRVSFLSHIVLWIIPECC